jgi:hypothetical protein
VPRERISGSRKAVDAVQDVLSMGGGQPVGGGQLCPFASIPFRGNSPRGADAPIDVRRSSRSSSDVFPRKHPVGARMSISANVGGLDQRVLTKPEATLGRGSNRPLETALEGPGGPCCCRTRLEAAEKGPESIRVR